MRRRSIATIFAFYATTAHAGPTARFPEVPTTSAPAQAPAPVVAAPPPVATESIPRRVPLRSGAEELADRGKRLEDAQRFTEAIGAYSESIKLDPSRAETLLSLAKLRLRLGDPSEAELLLTTAARYSSVAPEALTLRAHLRRSQGREAEAARDLENAAKLSPDDAARIQELSGLYVARGAWLPALALWRRAAAISREADRDKQTKLQVRALSLLAAELDPVTAGAGKDYSWTRRAIAKLSNR